MNGLYLNAALMLRINEAIAKAERLHPSFDKDNFSDVLGEEVGEVHRARLEGNYDAEQAELMDVIAVCVRRAWSIGT